MKYIYKHHPSKMTTLIVTFGAGSRVEFNTSYPKGIAHFLEHMRFKGSNNYTAKELLWKMETAGGEWNAFTEEDLVAFHITIPEENIETAFQCLSDMIRYPIFPQEELDKEQEVVCQEVRMYDDDIGDLVHRAVVANAFDNSSLNSPIIGTEESVCAITANDLRNFDKQFCSPEQELITLCGANDHRILVEKYFGTPDDKLIWTPGLKPSYCKPFEMKVEKEGQLQNIIKIAYGNHNINTLSFESAPKLDVFNTIFGSVGASRLFLRIREDLGLVYGIRSGIYDNMDGCLFEIASATEPDNVNELLKEVENQIQIMTNTLPTPEELICAKNKIRSSEYGAEDTSIGTALKAIDETFYNDLSSDEYLTEVEKVTAKDVQGVAQEIFSGNRYLVIGCDKESA